MSGSVLHGMQHFPTNRINKMKGLDSGAFLLTILSLAFVLVRITSHTPTGTVHVREPFSHTTLVVSVLRINNFL